VTVPLLALYLRGRRVGWAALLVVIAAELRRAVVPWTHTTGPFTTTVSLLLIAAAATVVAAGLTGPFGEAERSAGGLLAPLRLTQLTGTGALAAAAFAVAAATGNLSVAECLRDLAGFLGIALLAGAVLGGQRCWIPPVAYVLLCAGEQDLEQYPLWTWPILPTGNDSATLVALALLAAGAATATVAGLPDRS
jgi:hypothetical protein